MTGINNVDTSVAHPARRYNYWLGGKDNFEADRVSGDAVAAAFPGIRAAARANRAFLGRAVEFLTNEAGIRQFLDIGTGLPSANNTHEVAQKAAPESRIVYVDNDPIVLVHARALLTSTAEGRTAYIDADARDPEGILASDAMKVLDRARPVAVLLVAVLHFFADDAVAMHVVDTLMAAMAPGSYLVVSHAAAGLLAPEEEQQVQTVVATEDFKLRTQQEIAAFSAGLELADPGIVPVQRWRPPAGEAVPEDHEIGMYAFVARKPADEGQSAQTKVVDHDQTIGTALPAKDPSMIRVLGPSSPAESTVDICTKADLSMALGRKPSLVGKPGRAQRAPGRARTWRRPTLRAIAADA